MSVRYDLSELGVMVEQVTDEIRALELRLKQAEGRKMFEHRYTVQGKHSFPFDMLRYDASFPANGDDLAYGTVDSDQQEIEMVHRGRDISWHPTGERWSSFGWIVVRGSIRLVS